ncbi:glycosyltransferase family A protein [uncultured Chryseobacterium sp.]|uniref:glycosyltransferase family 2 protein n=1 Tax=uncultured Chryseobacterium sp. TaxID=259322 RepID=UPI0025DC97A1|nr:glycosyltransferase family A protein [uncultured Chryseobacterium sp.]
MSPDLNKVPVSVIIPVYNVEKFLSEAIESILNQTLTDFELILINDGSTDRSPEICKDYQKKDSRIKYFSQNNSGVSIARNLGLFHATGEYVFFMDSDDTLDHDFINTSYKCAQMQDSDLVIVGEEFCSRLPNVPALPTCAQFLRRNFLEKYYDVRFPENIQPCEDGLFSHQLIALTKKIGTNFQGLYHYRLHENQNHLRINEDSEKVLQQIPIWLTVLEDFYRKYNLYETHAYHLALFMEHEPFEFRYLNIPFTKEQKERLFNIIRDFTDKNILPWLHKDDYFALSRPFVYFLSCNNSCEFDKFYSKYVRNKCFQKKIRLLLIKFIPFGKIRRELRRTVSKKYSR